jgi:hypothetical protein
MERFKCQKCCVTFKRFKDEPIVVDLFVENFTIYHVTLCDICADLLEKFILPEDDNE